MEANRLFDALENETNVSIMDQTSQKIKTLKNLTPQNQKKKIDTQTMRSNDSRLTHEYLHHHK